MTRVLKGLRDPRRTRIFTRYSWFYHTNLRDFETHVLRGMVTFRVVFWESLKYGAFAILLSSNTVSSVRTGRKKISHLLIFAIRENEFFYPWSVILYFLRSWTVPETHLYNPPHCTTQVINCPTLEEGHLQQQPHPLSVEDMVDMVLRTLFYMTFL